jgi:phosphatidylinositol phospholipase C delta
LIDQIAIYGVPADKKKYHTKTHKSTKHPIWEKEEFSFPLTVPELALLAMEVRTPLYSCP